MKKNQYIAHRYLKNIYKDKYGQNVKSLKDMARFIEENCGYKFKHKTRKTIKMGLGEFLISVGQPHIPNETQKKKLKVKKKTYKETSKEFLDSREWKELRYVALKKHGRQCMCCGARPPQVVLHVDHIKPRFKYPELALDINNLQILCADCNQGKSYKHEDDFR